MRAFPCALGALYALCATSPNGAAIDAPAPEPVRHVVVQMSRTIPPCHDRSEPCLGTQPHISEYAAQIDRPFALRAPVPNGVIVELGRAYVVPAQIADAPETFTVTGDPPDTLVVVDAAGTRSYPLGPDQWTAIALNDGAIYARVIIRP